MKRPEPAALSTITAVCVDTLNHEMAIHACWSMAQHGFADVVLLTDDAADALLPAGAFAGFRVERIAPIRSRDAYSQFVLHSLVDYIHTPHALIFQWDGFVLDASQWRPEFLEYDYVGAPFCDGSDEHRRVGNGGFCLRSTKLMRAVAAMSPTSTEPEDRVICEQLAERLETEHGVRFAPSELAKTFSVDQLTIPYYRAAQPHLFAENTFGFHGFFNYHLAFGDFELLDIIDNRLGPTRDKLLIQMHTAALIVNLMAAGRQTAAVEIGMRSAAILGMDSSKTSLVDVVAACQYRF